MNAYSSLSSRYWWLAVSLFASLAIVSTASAEEEALLTPHGNALKVIVREPSALYREPDLKSPNEPVGAFEFFYVLPAEANSSEKLRGGFYRVAHSAKARRQAGWLDSKKVVEWPHAQCAGFTPLQGDRQRVLFFQTKEDTINWFKSGSKDLEAKAISREPTQKTISLFPLLGIDQFEADGEKVDFYKVAYLSGRGTSGVSNAMVATGPKLVTKPGTREDLKRDLTLQIAFVVDATASMTPWIDAMKQVIARLVEDTSRQAALKGRVQFALVLYRDQLDPEHPERQQAIEFVVRKVSDFSDDFSGFQRELLGVSAALVSSEDFPEDMLAGLQMGIKDLSWKPAAYKHIVLIGDAPAQVQKSGYKNVSKSDIAGITALAQPTGDEAIWQRIQIHGLRIVSEMPEECRQHFEELTKGREYPGLHYAYQGEQDADKFITDLTARLTDVARITADIATGNYRRVEDQASNADPGSDQKRLLGPILEMLRATDESSDSTPTFREGFAAVIDRDGNRSLEPHVLVAQSHLKLFTSALGHCLVALETSGEPGSRDVQKVVQSLQILATGVNLKEDVSADTPLADILSKVLGFPVRNPIFSMTPKKLTAMTTKDFAVWTDQVRASQSVCKAHLENGVLWFELGRTPAPASGDRQAFIKVGDLP